MTRDRIQAYREAAFLKYLRQHLSEAEDSKNLADWRVDVAVELIKAALGMESTRETSFTDRDDIAAVAARVLMLTADVQLSRRGTSAGYYPADFNQQVSMLLQATRNPLAELLTTVSDEEYDLQPPRDELQQLARLDLFLSDYAIWRDASTPSLAECLQYLVFASDDRWQRQLNEVNELSSAMHADPSLHLTAEKADSYAWVLGGAADLVNCIRVDGWAVLLGRREPPPEAFEGHQVYLPVIGQALRSHGASARFHQLLVIRGELVNRAQYLTSDVSVQTAAWFLAQANPERAQERDDVWHWGI